MATPRREVLVDITDRVKGAVSNSGIRNGIVTVYVQGATAAVMIQENWDESVQTDVVNFLRQIIPHGVWLHDHVRIAGWSAQSSVTAWPEANGAE